MPLFLFFINYKKCNKVMARLISQLDSLIQHLQQPTPLPEELEHLIKEIRKCLIYLETNNCLDSNAFNRQNDFLRSIKNLTKRLQQGNYDNSAEVMELVEIKKTFGRFIQG